MWVPNMGLPRTRTTQISSINSNSYGKPSPPWTPPTPMTLIQMEHRSQMALVCPQITPSNSSFLHQDQWQELRCNCTLNSRGPSKSVAEARRGWSCTSSVSTIRSSIESNNSANISKLPTQSSPRVDLQLQIALNLPLKLNLDLAANLIVSNKQISDLEEPVNIPPPPLGPKATTG